MPVKEEFKTVIESWPLPTQGILKDVADQKIPGTHWKTLSNAAVEYGKCYKLPGYERVGTFTLEGAVQLVTEAPMADGTTYPIFGCATDLFRYNVSGDSLIPITRYSVGTIDLTNGSPTLTSVSGTVDFTSYIKEGDQIITVDGVDISGDGYFVDSVDSPTQISLADAGGASKNWGGANKSGVSYTIRQIHSPLGWWDSAIYGDAIYFVNNVGPLYRWNGNPAQNFLEIVPDNPPVSKYVVAFDVFLVLLGIHEGGEYLPRSIAWCDAGNPDIWNVLGPGEAARRTLSEGKDWIVGAAEHNGRLMIYRDGAISFLEKEDTEFTFYSDNQSTGEGPVGRNAFDITPKEHYFLGRTDMFQFNGSDPEDIGWIAIQKWLIDLIHPQYVDSVFVWRIPEKNTIFVMYPSVSVEGPYADKFVILNYIEKTFMEGTVPNVSAVGKHELWETKVINDYTLVPYGVINAQSWLIDSRTALAFSPVYVIGDKDGLVWKRTGYDMINGLDATAINCSMRTGIDDFGDSSKYKRILGLWFDVMGSGSNLVFQMRVGYRNSPNNAWSWTDWMDIPVDGSNYIETSRLSDGSALEAKYFTREFRIQGVNSYFEIYDITVEYTVEGER